MKGDLTEVNLVDLIQVTCHHRSPSQLTVRHRDRKAALFFDGGELVHAELGALRGEEALCEVLKWSQGSFELDKSVPPPARTLSGSSTVLLLSAMGQIDEERSGRGTSREGLGSGEIDLSDEALQREMSVFEQSMRSEIEGNAAPSGDAMTDETAEQDIVHQLRRIPGVDGALKVAPDGTVLAHDLSGDPEPAAAVTVFVGNAASELGESLAIGCFERGAVTVGGERTLVIEQPDFYVGLVLAERASPDLVHSQARKLLH